MKGHKLSFRKLLVIPLAALILLLIFVQATGINRQEGQEETVGNDSPDLNSDFAENTLEKQAEKLINKAFLFNASEIPFVESNDSTGITSFQYSFEEDDCYVVEFKEGYLYPTLLYHFFHFEDSQEIKFDLANEADEFFKEEMISIAKEFVQNVYDVDCSKADVHGFGYGNKIAVQLNVAEDIVFQVRFYYEDLNPVGVLFCDNAELFKENMEFNQAKTYF